MRAKAARAIGALGAAVATPEVLAELLILLHDANGSMPEAVARREAVAHAIGDLGAAAATPETLEALLALLHDANWEVRSAAARAVAQFSMQGVQVIMNRRGKCVVKTVPVLSRFVASQ